MKNLICPISPLRVDEHVVRFTALWIVLLSGYTVLYPNYYIPLLLAGDFFIRAFTKAKYSPMSRFSALLVQWLKLKPVLIDKAPKIFAARIGFLLTLLITLFAMLGLQTPVIIVGSVLMLFAFLECGINFCAGCWIYTYLVLPVYRPK